MTETESLNELRALADRQPTEGDQMYWLLDQSALPQAGWLKRLVGRAAWIDLLSGSSETAFNGASPIIVSATLGNPTANSHVANQLYRVGRFTNGIALIASKLLIAALQASLARRARVDLPGQMEAVLRYFDTRTLPLLPRLLSTSQYADFMQGIQNWHYLDRWGAIQSLPLAADAMDAHMAVPARLTLDEAQEAMLIDDGLTDAVIDLLLTQQHPELLERLPPEQFDLVDPLVHGARTAGLWEPFEALGFVAKALSEGADFSQREPWRSRLMDYAQKRCSIEAVFA